MAIKSPQGSIIDTPRGTSDYNARDSIAINEIASIIEEVFKRFGFSPIITPAIENTEVLNAKAYGEESTKEMFVLEGGDAALRFDLTVPLSRFMAMNKDIPLPFKRYQIGNVWRKDEPQFMRSRELMQADVDIVGSTEVSGEVECMVATLTALEALGMRNYTLLLNSRPILTLILGYFKIPAANHEGAIRIIDKMSKISVAETIKQLEGLGIDDRSAQALLQFITEGTENGEKLNRLEMNIPDSRQETDKLRAVLNAIGDYEVKGEVKVDFSLARGLDYYTGPIWEITVKDESGMTLPSIGSGGRYDRLIGMYSKTPLPAVGSSIGITRVFSILKNRNERKTYADAYVAQIGKGISEYSINVATKLRSNGIYVDLNVTDRSISKQLEYSNSLGIKYVIIIGKQEADLKKLKLRDMQTGTEELLDLADVITKLKK